MISKTLVTALAFSAVASAVPTLQYRDDQCQDTYNVCVAAGTPEVACACTLTACLGEDNARNREYCASATASLNQPTPTSIPGGCNPAHPGSCPSSYFSTLPSTPVATSIPGGCNPAHPGSCPSSYFSTVTVSQSSSPTPSAVSAAGSNPTKVEGKTWSITDLTRYCGEGNTGCDYNFVIQANGKTERCTIIRMPGSNAATESWSNQPCTSGSQFTVSWGYVASPAPAYAVITVVNGKELAWIGVSDINGQKVTPSNPFGSGQYGNLSPAQVYTYN